MSSSPSRRGDGGGFVLAGARVAVAMAAALALETLVVALAHARVIAGTWETAALRNVVYPLALTMFLPLGFAFVPLGRLAARSVEDRLARRLLAGFAMIFGAAVAWGVSTGRHMQVAPRRTLFVLAVSLVGGVATFALAPRLAKRSPHVRAALGALAAVAFWLTDKLVLPRLYPAFHTGLFFLCAASVALSSLAVPMATRRTRVAVTVVAALLGLVAATAPLRAGKLAAYDNLRLVLVDHAPLLGRAVAFAARFAPPSDATGVDGGQDASSAPPGEEPPSLDFRGKDILLISIDALRADHVGAYGYGRPTTPVLDALAREGARFEAAYSPTPHTSYAVTSMLTGKYMRPLLALDLGHDSETWAGLLRRYGYRTAAFYPPAVFFIDEALFGGFRDRGLDFEYRRVEFRAAADRAAEVGRYLEGAPAGDAVFLWVHLFEPHEPYVAHAAHPFGGDAPKPIDAYDSEIAAADAAVGRIVRAVRARRPGAVIVVTADHGEEFGEHGGRYHGTTVYDEQVRVPLIVVGPGIAPRVVAGAAQTIDVLPTVLSALRIPRPARIRGRDLGPALVGRDVGPGFAFSETDDHTLVAEGSHRLVCARRIGACSLYDTKDDPAQTRDRSRERPEIAARLRIRGAELGKSHGRFESGAAAALPEVLRRGLQGDAEVALDVAALLEDVRLELRRAAARALYEMVAPSTVPFAARAFARETDAETRHFAALTLVRLGAAPDDARGQVEGLLGDAAPWPVRAGLALTEGAWRSTSERDASTPAGAEARPPSAAVARGSAALVGCLSDASCATSLSFLEQRAIVTVLGQLRERSATSALVRHLADVRLRPFVVTSLAALGDRSARPALLQTFATERYVSLREPEARALLALGATASDLSPALERFAGVPEPWPAAMRVATETGLALSLRAGPVPAPRRTFEGAPAAGGREGGDHGHPDGGPRPNGLRVYVRSAASRDAGSAEARLLQAGAPLEPVLRDGDITVYDVPSAAALTLDAPAFLWIVPRSEELPPPAPTAWDAGADSADSGPQSPTLR